MTSSTPTTTQKKKQSSAPQKKRKIFSDTQLKSIIKNHVDDSEFLIGKKVPSHLRKNLKGNIKDLMERAEIVRASENQITPCKTILQRHIIAARKSQLVERAKLSY